MPNSIIVEATPEISVPPLPPTLEGRAKSFFKRTNVPQIAMGSKPNYIHSFLYGPHTEKHIVFNMPIRYKQGSAAAKALLVTLQAGIEMFDGPFEVRHLLPKFSKYYTLAIIEEEYKATANATEVAHIRALMDLEDITTYDFSAKTGALRGLLGFDSVSKPSTRFINVRSSVHE